MTDPTAPDAALFVLWLDASDGSIATCDGIRWPDGTATVHHRHFAGITSTHHSPEAAAWAAHGKQARIVWPDASERPEPAPACTHRCSCGHDQQDHSTSGYCNACEDHCDDNDGHYPDDCDARTTPDNPAGTYPHPDGDVTVLGPEIFASSDGAVISWKGENYVRPDNPTAEDLNSGPPNASRLDICELPHQTIAEEDDCHRRRDAGSDDGLRLALARIASDRAHHEHCASLARTSEGGIAHSSIAAGLQIAEAHLTAALDGPADTTPPAGSTAREAPGA